MRKSRLALWCVLIVMWSGCSPLSVLEPRKDPSEFYVLTPIDSPPPSAPLAVGRSRRPLAIGVGPIKMPAYLARLEIVTRSSPNRIDLSDKDRWAEPLDKNFTNVLSQNLTSILSAHVVTFPWYRPIDLDYQVTMEISRFDTDDKGTAQLVGRWEIKDPDTGAILNSGETNLSEPAQAGETQAATLSRALGDLSQQLADAIRASHRPSTHAAQKLMDY